ncbi:hypothetical protein HK100_011776 [Physocladia obscura]|uniref:Growth hormone-inducible transmembrane protein n=1 Tax=Physocladia obscura TaxID=109957 RepID=A0AAD5TEF8_9FUNG|nr:hypothetical protein HK100_011776 [Physocladia obscura]
MKAIQTTLSINHLRCRAGTGVQTGPFRQGLSGGFFGRGKGISSLSLSHYSPFSSSSLSSLSSSRSLPSVVSPSRSLAPLYSSYSRYSSYSHSHAYSPPTKPPSTARIATTVGLVVATGFVLDAALNKDNESVGHATTLLGGGDTHEAAAAREYLHATFRYVGGALVVTAASAIALRRVRAVQMLLAARPVVASVGGLVATVCLMVATLQTDARSNPALKHTLFGAFAACEGLMLSPLLFLHPAVLSRALAYSAAIVGSLSYVAATAETDRFLYLGGPLFAALCLVALSSLSTLFVPASSVALPFLHSVSLYGGLAVFGGFVLYDTQKVLKHGRLASAGLVKPDCINESISLIAPHDTDS